MSFLLTDQDSRVFEASTAFKFSQSGGIYSHVIANPAANRTINWADPGGTDTVAYISAAQTFSNKTLGTNLAAGGFNITGLANPSSAQDAATKAYVDNLSAGLSWKGAVRVATTTNIASLAGGAPDTLDGVSLASTDRILVKDQSTGSQNGLYTVTTLGTGSDGTWTRATDFDGASDVPAAGTIAVFVSEGTVNSDKGFVLTTNAPYTIGSDSLAFTQFTGGATYTEGDGIDITSNIITAVGDETSIHVAAGGISIKTTWAGQTAITTLGTISTGTWSATTIAINKGGTGQTSALAAFNALSPLTTLGDTPYHDGTDNKRLAGNTTTTKKYLSQTGNGSVSAAPSWAQVAFADLSGVWRLPRRVVSSADGTIVAGTDVIVEFSTSNTDRIANLPTAISGTAGYFYVITKTDSGTGKVTITPDSCSINGASTKVIDRQWDSISVYDNGSNYIIF